jgi:hypothetical protein
LTIDVDDWRIDRRRAKNRCLDSMKKAQLTRMKQTSGKAREHWKWVLPCLPARMSLPVSTYVLLLVDREDREVATSLELSKKGPKEDAVTVVIVLE